MSFERRWTSMRLICLAIIMLLIFAAHAKEEEDDEDHVTFDDFTLYLGDRIEVGDYKADLIEIQSVKDGLAVMRVSKTGGSLDEQRALLQNNANNFDGGAEEGGLTLTVEDIFDEESAKIRIEYREGLGTARKRTSDRPRTTGDMPNLVITKSFDREILSVGDDVQVTVTVKNVGAGTATDVVVEDIPPMSEFTYVAGYPPKIRDKLEPGDSDAAVYVISAVKEGTTSVPAITVRYQDSKENSKSNSSEPFMISIAPKSKPDLVLTLTPASQISEGKGALLNISIANSGKASATRVEITAEIKPSDGLETSDLDRTYFEIAPGGVETYSAEMKGITPGTYTILLKASYLGDAGPGDERMFSEGKAEVVVLEREYKYLYYLLLLPAALAAVWIYKRYREYKY